MNVCFQSADSQHLEGMCGLIGPFMANVTTFGLLFWCGYEFTALLAIVPFLVFAIGRSFEEHFIHECASTGVDDSYMLLAGMRHARSSTVARHRMQILQLLRLSIYSQPPCFPLATRNSVSPPFVGERVAHSMSLHGVGVTLTSFTDILCYLIGIFSTLLMCVLFRFGLGVIDARSLPAARTLPSRSLSTTHTK
jgi:hypothetical protein